MRRRDDAGAATVELLALTLVLVIPLLYLVIAMGRVQAGAYAAEAASYAAARTAVVTGLDSLQGGAAPAAALAEGEARARAAAEVALADFGIDQEPGVTLACDGGCLDPGTTVSATVTVPVPLPGVPALIREWIPLEVTLDATGFAPVDGLLP